MSSWYPAGSPSATPWRHGDHPTTLHAPTHGAVGEASFPVPNVTAAIARYLAYQPPPPPQLHNHTCTRRPPIGVDTSLPPPRRHNYAPLQPWAPRRHEHRAAPAFAPPPPSLLPSWTLRPNVMIPGEVPDASPGGGAAGATGVDEPGCLRVARRAGCKAAGEGRNFLLSPLSLHAALALVTAGTKGQTRRELLGFLGSGSLAALQRAAATKLVGALRGLPQTSFACGVWVDRRRALRPEFAEVAGDVYAAAAESVDFVSQAEQVRQRVNAFVTDATKGLIRDVLPPGSVHSSTVVILANALYFKGTWALPFDSSRTFTAPFYLPDGTTVRAPFMTTSLFEQQIAVFPGFRSLKLPYKNDGHQIERFYMLLLLPDNAALKLGDLYSKAVSTPEFIRKHTPAAKVPVERFMVPKFKFMFEFEASKDMQELGVTRAFGGGDFSGMVTPGDELFIDAVYHKATVEVDEIGTVAAASTAVCIMESASGSPPVDFVADRPFLFAIVEERSGAVLFSGHVVNPLAE